MKLISIVILCLFIYIKCDLNCINISPYYSSDCVLSDQDLRNTTNLKYCCYLEFEKYNYYSYSGARYSTTIKKCFPYNQTEYNKVYNYYDTYYYSKYYPLYGELNYIKCNNRSLYEEEKTTETGCNSIKPSTASDCKLSTNEQYYNNLCCYVQDTSHVYPYCQKYTKSEVDSETTNMRRYTSSKSTFVCISSQASFLKISFFIIGILLL